MPLAPNRAALAQSARSCRAAGARRPTRRDTCRESRSTSRCPRPSARSSSGSSTRAAGRSPSAAATRPSPVARQAHLPALPPLRQLADRRHAALRRGARGARHSRTCSSAASAFHEREEIEAIRAALAAVEWPDDELSVFATLRGPFFAISDEDAARMDASLRAPDGEGVQAPRLPSASHPRGVRRRHAAGPRAPAADRRGAAAPQAPPSPSQQRLADGGDGREWGGASGVLHELLGATRAHVGFALRIGGEQALANAVARRGAGAPVRARRRHLVPRLRRRAARGRRDAAQAAEAPILEEDSDGVRMMTVHKAKGLEFPIVILADLTCKLSRAEAGRWIDPAQTPVRAQARRLGADRPAAARRRGIGPRSRRRRAARLRRRHSRARRARRPGDRRRGLRRRLARSADAGDLPAACRAANAVRGAGLPGVSRRRTR